MKVTGWFIISGGIFTALATLFHPIVINPWSPVIRVLPKTVLPFWMWDHILMLVGLTLWLMGLVAIKPVLKLETWPSLLAVFFFTSSYVVWFMILLMELGTFPFLGKEVLAKSDHVLGSIWAVLFSYGLFTGYGGMLLAYLGMIFLSLGLPKWRRIRTFGIPCGTIGAIGIVLTLILIKWGIVILAVTTLPPYIWSLCMAKTLITESTTKFE